MTFNNLTSMKKLDEQPESVKPGFSNIVKDYPVQPNKPKNGNGSMYTAYAKDIFCAMMDKPASKEIGQDMMVECMAKAIELVKQAKEAFE